MPQNGEFEFGEGVDPNFVEWMKDKNGEPRYIDLVQVFGNQAESYSDFEGFADPGPVKAQVERVMKSYAVTSDVAPVIKTILYHLVFEANDQADGASDFEVEQWLYLLESLFTSRFYMKEIADES